MPKPIHSPLWALKVKGVTQAPKPISRFVGRLEYTVRETTDGRFHISFISHGNSQETFERFVEKGQKVPIRTPSGKILILENGILRIPLRGDRID